MRINGRRCRLWRAVDQHGYVLDEIVQTRPNTKAARHLLIRLLKKQGLSPKRIVTDKLRSYSAVSSTGRTRASTTGRRTLTCRFESGSESGKASAALAPSAFRLRLLRHTQSLCPLPLKQVRHADPNSPPQCHGRMEGRGVADCLKTAEGFRASTLQTM